MEGHAATRWLVVLGRRYRPQLRFLWDRVTPGGTFGLEFTSLMAVLAVSLFVLVAYVVVIGRDPGPTPGDVTAMELAEHLRAGWFTDFSKVFTFLGSGVFTWGLTVVCAALLAARRRWAELGVLLAGMTLISIGIHEIKDAVDRPRPGGGAGRHLRLLVPERPRRPLGPLRLAGGDDRAAPAAGDGARRGGRRGRVRADDPGRALPRLPQRPLPQRRQRRLGAGRRLPSPSAPPSALVISQVRQNPRQ